MFSGIGGFELGIQRACNKQSAEIEQDRKGGNGVTDKVERDVLSTSGTAPLCVGFSEIDKYAIQIYQNHFKGHKNYGNARNIVWEQVPYFDLFVGGFPCQAFSIAGKRGGFEDTRGTLFFEIARALAAKRPKLCLLENVRGLLSHDKGKTFGTILTTLSGLGYFLKWQVLNSKDFGVPQNRERVFIVGHLGGEGGGQVFPIGEGGKSNDRTVAHAINSSDWRGGNRNQKQTTIAVLTPDREQKRQNGRRFKNNGEPAFTLTGQDIHGVYDGYRIRRLTPTECERLQGFPDGWTEGVSDTQRYKCLGNAVTVNVIEAIMRKLLC